MRQRFDNHTSACDHRESPGGAVSELLHGRVSDRYFPDLRDLLMYILRISHGRRIALGLGLVGALVLAGCDGAGTTSESAIATVKDGEHGKAQLEARQKAFGATANPVTGKTKTGIVEPKGAPEKAP